MDVFDLYSKAMSILCDHRQTKWIAPLLLLGDAALTALVVLKVPYTEIDFTTYMQQVQLFQKGVYDYTLIEGDTGPCVYPAGHLYIYSLIYYLTDHGRSILQGQIVLAGVYLVTLALVMSVYRNCKAPPYLFPLLILSKRLHSIFVLRLFNDCFATFFLFLAILALQHRRWLIGSVAISLGVGVKMSILLAVPGVVLVLGQAMPVFGALVILLVMVMVQVLLGAPFLSANPIGYLSRAFEFSREFLFKWTVNWRFVGEEIFLSRGFYLSLFLFHCVLLVFFALTRWTKPAHLSVESLVRRVFKPLPVGLEAQINARVTPTFVATTILTSMAVGMLVARSLHYQFYANIAWATPLLLWRADVHPILIYGVWAIQEWGWNVFPSTNASSLVVVAALGLQVLIVWWGTRNDFDTRKGLKSKKEHLHSR